MREIKFRGKSCGITLGTPWSDHEELGKSTLLERVVRDFEDVVKYKEIFKDNRIDFSK